LDSRGWGIEQRIGAVWAMTGTNIERS